MGEGGKIFGTLSAGTAWLLGTQNLENKSRKPTYIAGMSEGATGGGLNNPYRAAPAASGTGSHSFPQDSTLFFYPAHSSQLAALKKNAAKFRVGGVGHCLSYI
jgi:hypothetical protein